MSSASDARTVLLSASEIETRAASYLQRRQFWEWTQEDQADLDRWLAESAVHLVTYLRLEAAWARSERLVALRGGTGKTTEIASRNRLWPLVARIGGAACIAAILSIAAWNYFSMSQEIVYTTPIGAHRVVTLADNSILELNTDTVLRINGRTASLEKGEAYFQIKHNPAHPFVVWAQGHRITDLGTKFVVRNDVARLEVTLVEGRARVDSAAAGAHVPSANLEPGDVAIATASAITVTKKPMREVADGLGWRRGLLTFRHETLADAAAEFNRYNAGKLIIADPELGRKKIVGTFQARNEALFAGVLQELLGLRVSKSGEDIVISR